MTSQLNSIFFVKCGIVFYVFSSLLSGLMGEKKDSHISFIIQLFLGLMIDILKLWLQTDV